MSWEAEFDLVLHIDDRKRLPRLYFDAAIAALHRANFLSKHSIYTIQTIVIVVVTCQDVGGSDLIATLLACGIRIAQHLNIHRFGSDAEWESRRRANGVDPKSQEGIKGLIQRELRKRLWYALTIEVSPVQIEHPGEGADLMPCSLCNRIGSVFLSDAPAVFRLLTSLLHSH